MNSLLQPLKALVRVIRNFEVGDYSPIMDELFDAEEAIETSGWKKVSDALPTEYGEYLVIRGHWHMGCMSYELAVTNFHPLRKRSSGWHDRGFVYTHWIGPITKPDMDLKEFPILIEKNPAESNDERIRKEFWDSEYRKQQE